MAHYRGWQVAERSGEWVGENADGRGGWEAGGRLNPPLGLFGTHS